MFNSIITGSQITLPQFLICVCCAVALGLLTALIFTASPHKGTRRPSSSFAVSVAMLPAVVTVVIMLVNGNLGAGLAVAGTFALVRFRSNPGTAREITGMFFAVALGLICGMGYIGYAFVFFVLVAGFFLLLNALGFGGSDEKLRTLRVTVPENLDYEDLFDDLFADYLDSWELTRVKTSNMGTLYDLTYEVILKRGASSKAFLDQIRTRNGNLNLSLSREKEKDSVI